MTSKRRKSKQRICNARTPEEDVNANWIDPAISRSKAERQRHREEK